MANKDLLIPNGLLETCQAWQEVVDSVAAPEEKEIVALDACRSVRSIDGYFGVKKVIVKSDVAIILADDQPVEEAEGIQYREITAKGMLGRVTYVNMLGYGAIAWSLYDAAILFEPKIHIPDGGLPLGDEQPPQTDRTSRPLYLPVSFIDYALCAA